MGGRQFSLPDFPQEASSCRSQQTQFVPRVQSQVNFGQAPEALRGFTEMSLNLNVLRSTPIDNFLGQVLVSLIVYPLLWSPEKLKFSLWRHHLVQLNQISQSCRPFSLVSARGLSTLCLQPLVISATVPFLLGTTCLAVPEKPDLTFPLAKSSRLGPNSLSNITSLLNKGTPNPSTFAKLPYELEATQSQS